MFMKGETEDGTNIDNTGEEFVKPWLDAVKEIAPREVMIYTIDRETPDHSLQKPHMRSLMLSVIESLHWAFLVRHHTKTV